MEKIVVDPKTFIICRLCLEDTGMYQITPAVQSQIKYCFDIDVDPFDSMPQLICNKCETILSEYVTIKRTFVGKQNALLARREVQKGLETTQQGVVSSSQENDNYPDTPRERKPKIDISGGFTSSATEGHSRSTSPATRKKKKNIKKRRRCRKELWEDNYNKTFVCRLCNKQLTNQGNVMRHVRQAHRNILHEHKALFKPCMVQLEKVDQKPNHINSLNVVVSPNKIVCDKGGIAYYHIIYTPMGYTGMPDENEYEYEPRNTKIEPNSSDDEMLPNHSQNKSDSSDDEILVKRPQNKRRRLLSRSSNDTVCLDRNTETNVAPSDVDETADSGAEVKNETELINIDDTSDSEQGSTMSAVEPVTSVGPKSLTVSMRDCKTIQRIISTCQNKYLKKVGIEIEENSATNSDLNINNKILNIGRKVINKPNMGFKGLLRFVANKNLELEWQSIPEGSMTNKENFVRILPKLKGKQDNNDKIGWKFTNSDEIMDTEQSTTYPETEKEQCSDAINVGINGPTFRVDDLLKQALIVEQNKKVTENKADVSDKFLLNANPVANPKQLPKKIACPKSAKPKNSVEAPNSKPVYDNLVIVPTGVLEADLHMPIITSTTSLAVIDGNVNSKTMNHQAASSEAEMIFPSDALPTSDTPHDGDQNTDITAVSSAIHTTPVDVIVSADISKTIVSASTDSGTPRIKVKPVSELMSKTALNNMNQRPVLASPSAWNLLPSSQMKSNQENNPAPVLLAHSQYQMPITSVRADMPLSNQVLTANSNTNANAINGNPKPDYLILDSVTFPNTKTYSPINYVQNLLRTHNIILLDSESSLTPDFSCLIKFKVQFTRDIENQMPVVLLLSLYGFENQFYLGVREPNGGPYISIHSLSACWQWEVIKMYTSREDVNQKLLYSAKKVSQKVYDYTNTFLCLVKSIRVTGDM